MFSFLSKTNSYFCMNSVVNVNDWIYQCDKLLFGIKENWYTSIVVCVHWTKYHKISYSRILCFSITCKYDRRFSLKLVNEFIYRILIHVFKMRSDKGSENHAEVTSWASNSAQRQYFVTFLIASCKGETRIRTSSPCLFTLFD